MEKQQRYCSRCKIEIEKGFLCDKCKVEDKKENVRNAQHRAYIKRKEERARLIKENEALKQRIKELENAN